MAFEEKFMNDKKQNIFLYRVAQIVCFFVAAIIFKRRIIRNEIKGKKGPFVVIANHQMALDFVNLIGATSTPMRFVISNSFYSSLPIKGFLDKIGVIPKQQFQTTVRDMKRMKAVVDGGGALVIYPAGLMCEDGLSTPIPTATYKFLKWMGADIYVARSSGTYFTMPKWAKGIRAGRTYIDIYKLFSADELNNLEVPEIKARTDEAMLFDAYREQEKLLVKYKNNDNVEGLQNVLYMCPNCGSEFSMSVCDKNTLCCSECGFAHKSDEYGFLHNIGKSREEIRYVSDWSRMIYERLKCEIESGSFEPLSAKSDIYMIDAKTNKFALVGEGNITLTNEHFLIDGDINSEKVNLKVPISNFASLPFSPGKHLEIQHGGDIYRCVLEDGRFVMKFINMVKIFYELNSASRV